MKQLLFTVLLLCSTNIWAERWVQIQNHIIDIDYTVSRENPQWRIYRSQDLVYNIKNTLVIDCKHQLYSIIETQYLSGGQWFTAPKNNTWYPISGTDAVYRVICR